MASFSPFSAGGRHRRRGSGASWRTLAGALALCLGFGACAEEKTPAPPLEPDAGPLCERGTENCLCTGSGRCDDPLLCIAGRCLSSNTGEDPPEPPIMRPTLRPPRPDAGGGSGSVPDAGPPPDASALPDATAPADAAAEDASQSTSDELDAGPG